MRALLAFGLVAIAVLALALSPSEATILGLEQAQFARLIYGGSIAFVLLGSLLLRYRGRLGRAVVDLAWWVGLTLVLVAGYSYRFELGALTGRIVGELMPGATVEGSGGEVIVSRRMDGNFVVRMSANGVNLPFVFDTGASSVVVRAEDAEKIGLRTSDLSFDIPISTANGRALAAETEIARLSVGRIVLQRVPALVTKPGALRENLLGMSFLDKLQSFTVAGDKLILKGKLAVE
ncbi:MAG: TIGR02281 family clan AA aspartic protease [Methylobacteriaceae bacterium]|nr:TIGR02281 family clan AA aspartic protease [Methylobacteriaceae bacterium]